MIDPSVNALHELITELSYLKKDLGIASKEYLLVQKIKRLTNLVIWGDKHNPLFFESFKQSRIVELFFEVVLRGSSKDLIICSIDCFSKLLINVVTNKSLAYLISSQAMINLLSIKFKSLVTEVAEYYINFLKTLSQKLSDANISLFLNARCPNMPLAWQSIRFMHHPESLIRNTARNIILSILKLRDQTAINYLTNFPFVIFYSHFSSLIRSHWDSINLAVETQIDPAKFSLQMNEYDDLYLYFEDMLRIAAQPVKRCIMNGFLCEGLGFLVGSLLGVKKSIGIRASLYLLGHIVSNTQNPFLADFICMVFFGRYTNSQLVFGCTSAGVICSFRKEWNFRSFWDNYEDKLRQYSLTVFSGKQIPKQPVKQEKSREADKFTQNGHWFGQSDGKYQSELSKLSAVYGFAYKNVKPATVFDVFCSAKKEIIENQLSQGAYSENNAKKTILKCLGSQDDTLTMLSMKLTIGIISNKHVSKEILLFSGLAVDDHTGEKQNKFFIFSILRSCLVTLRTSLEGYSLRIQTVKIAVGVISKLFQSKTMVMPLELHKMLFSLYQLSIQRANLHLLSAKSNWEKTLEQYEAAETQCNKHQTFKMVPSDLMFADRQIKTVSTGDSKLFYDFVAFILLRNLRYQLFPSRVKLSEVGLMRKNTLRIKIEPGKQVTMNDFPKEDRISCKYKDLNQNKYSPCYLIPSKLNLTIVEQIGNGRLGVVISSSHKHIVNMIDRSDPRKLIVISNEQVKRNLSLIFDDAKTCYLTKAKLDSLKTESLNQYFLEVIKCVEVCFQDLTFSV